MRRDTETQTKSTSKTWSRSCLPLTRSNTHIYSRHYSTYVWTHCTLHYLSSGTKHPTGSNETFPCCQYVYYLVHNFEVYYFKYGSSSCAAFRLTHSEALSLIAAERAPSSNVAMSSGFITPAAANGLTRGMALAMAMLAATSHLSTPGTSILLRRGSE